MIKQYAEHLDNWVQAVGAVLSEEDQSRLEAVNAMYHPEASLLPTIKNGVHQTTEERISYFKIFAPNVTGAFWAKPHVNHSQELGTITMSGDYFFVIDGTITAAEYIFIFKDHSTPLIIHHTSRYHPEKIVVSTHGYKSKVSEWF